MVQLSIGWNAVDVNQGNHCNSATPCTTNLLGCENLTNIPYLLFALSTYRQVHQLGGRQPEMLYISIGTTSLQSQAYACPPVQDLAWVTDIDHSPIERINDKLDHILCRSSTIMTVLTYFYYVKSFLFLPFMFLSCSHELGHVLSPF